MLINHLYNENHLITIERLKELKEPPVDMVITSPPYGSLRDYEGYEFDFEKLAYGLFEILKPGGVVVWITGDQVINGSESLQSFKQAIFFVENAGFKLNDTMIYGKIGGLPNNDGCRYEQMFEYVFCFSKGKPKTFNPIMRKNKTAGKVCGNATQELRLCRDVKSRSYEKKVHVTKAESVTGNIWFYNTGFPHSATDKESFQHPAIFPEKLAHDHIKSWSDPGDLIFDPMAGSGTSIKAAIALDRDYIASEISEKYCNKIIKPRINRLLIQRPGREIE
jgi:site-specific DNA-methyltransferase (adenine-specific)